MAGEQLVTTIRLDGTGRYLTEMARVEGAHVKYGRTVEQQNGTAARGLRAFENAAVGVAAVTAGLGAASLKSAIDFETAFTGVTKTVDGTVEQLDQIRTGLLDLSETPRGTAEELSAIAEAAGQLGIATDNVLGFTETMADLGQTTNLSAEQAATTLARFANITGTAQSDFDRLGSTIVALGNNFATTESEISDMAIRVAGAGTAVGLSADEILSLSAALSSVGIQAEAGGTAISQVLFEINTAVEKGADGLAGFAELAGTSADEFARAWEADPAAALDSVILGIGRLSEDGGNLSTTLDSLGLSGIRVQQALIAAGNAGSLTAEAFSTGADAFRENSALAEEASKRYETTEARLQALAGTARRALIDVGTERLPDLLGLLEDNSERLPEILENLADAGVNLIEAFAQGLPVIETLARLLAAIPPDVLTLISLFGIASKAVRAFGVASASVTGGTTASAAAGGPLGIALAAAAAITFAGVTSSLDRMGAQARDTQTAVNDLGAQLRDILSGQANEFTFSGLTEAPAIEFKNPASDGAFSSATNAFAPFLTAKDNIEDLTTTFQALRGEYQLTETELARAGISQQQFAEAALEGGDALDEIADRLDRNADFWGAWGDNARDAATDAGDAIRTETNAALDEMVAQGAIAEGALNRIRQSTRETRTELGLGTEFVTDPDTGLTTERVVRTEIEVLGEENLTRVVELTAQYTQAADFAAQAAERLGVAAELVPTATSVSVGVDGLVDVENLTDLLFDLSFNGDRLNLGGLPTDLQAATLEAGALSTKVDDTLAAATSLANAFRNNPDLSFLEAERLAADTLGISVADLRTQVPSLHGALFDTFGAGTSGKIDSTALSTQGLVEAFAEAEERVATFEGAMALADEATAQAESSFAGLGYSAATVTLALQDAADADGALGQSLFNTLTQARQGELAYGLLTGQMGLVADTANELGLTEQELANIQAGLADSIKATADAYKASIPTLAEALGTLKAGLGEGAEASLGAFLESAAQQQQDAFAFTGNIGALQAKGRDDLAAAIVELAESDPLQAATFAASAVAASDEVAAGYERAIEQVRVGEEVLAGVRDTQATQLTLTNQEVLAGLESDGGETAARLAELWGVTVEDINRIIGTIGDTDTIVTLDVEGEEAVQQAAADAAFALAGIDKAQAVAQLQADPEAFDRELGGALLRIAGFNEEEAQSVLDADDETFQLAIARAFVQLGIWDQSSADAFILAQIPPGNLQAVENSLAFLARTRTAEIVVNYSTGNKSARAQDSRFGIFKADGGIVDYYSAGGVREHHTAQIAPAGAWRIWAEPETGGEAYIPMGLPKRARSKAILDQVANLFGYQLISDAELRLLEARRQARWFAQGGITGPPPPRATPAMTGPPTVVSNSSSTRNETLAGAQVTVQTPNPQAFAEWLDRRARQNTMIGLT